MKNRMVKIYDTTLRDGAQNPEISFSLHSKLAIMHWLDRIGVQYIELGYAGSNKKDDQVFVEAKKDPPQQAKVVAFGRTCLGGNKPENDHGFLALLNAETEYVTIFGKASRFHVEEVLRVSLNENLRMIRESCKFLVKHGRKVFFDAEHFFDGYKLDHAYSLKCIEAAIDGGASEIILCDTNGGTMPTEIGSIIKMLKKELFFPLIPLGIHAHNDGEMAVANSLAAVEVGVGQVQVTVNGYGERCGNANLCSVVPALKLKMERQCIPDENLKKLTELANFVAAAAKLQLHSGQPYVGGSAFCHKAGPHVDAMLKNPNSYQHIDPVAVGNKSLTVASEVAGSSNIKVKAKEFGIDLTPGQIRRVLAQVKGLGNKGWQFEVADGSLKLLMLRAKNGYKHCFNVLSRDVRSQQKGRKKPTDSAILEVEINNSEKSSDHYVAFGGGPVNALDNALRKALLPHFPCLKKIKLVDYRVGVLDGKKGTNKTVRVLTDFSDGKQEWTVASCSKDIIEASKKALADGLECAILMSK